MRIAVVQTDPVFGDPRANTEEALALMASDKADLYVLPELFTSGYNFSEKSELEALAEAPSGPTFETMLRFAGDRSCYIAYGFPERSDQIYNSSVLLGPDGLVGLYRKVHLFFRERTFFSPGNLGFPVFDLPFGRVGMMICFDWIYPEAARALALRGAQLIIHPSNLVLPHCPDAMVTRCLENRIFAATANRIGHEDRGGLDLRFIGLSEVVAPSGAILTRLERGSSGIGLAELNLAEADDKELNAYNDLLRDRRPEFYGA